MALQDIPIIGPLGTAIFGDPRQERLQREMQQYKKAMQEYRPFVEAAHMRGLNQRLMAHQPMNRYIGAMFGPEAMVDLQALGQNPLHPPLRQHPDSLPQYGTIQAPERTRPPPQGPPGPGAWPNPLVNQAPPQPGLPGAGPPRNPFGR